MKHVRDMKRVDRVSWHTFTPSGFLLKGVLPVVRETESVRQRVREREREKDTYCI